MAETTERVSTEVKLEDLTSTPLGKIGQAYDNINRKASRAQLAAAEFSKASRAQPTGYAAAAKAWGVSPAALAADAKMPEKVQRASERRAPAAEEDRFSQIREETRARRARIRGLKLEEQRGDILENAMGSLSGVLGGQQTVFGRLAGIGEQVGFQMSAFGGNMGSFGAKLVGAAGTVGLVAAGATIAYEGFKALDDALGISDWMAGAASAEEITRRNEAFAKASGFASNAMYKTTTALIERSVKDIQLARQAEQVAKKVGAMPLDQTSAAMEAWEAQLIRVAGTTAQSSEDIEKLAMMARTAATQTTAAWLKTAQRQTDLDATINSVAGVLARVRPAADATPDVIKAYNEEAARLVDANVMLGKLKSSEAQGAIEAATSRAKEIETHESVIEQYRKQEELQSTLNFELKRQVAGMRGVSPNATPSEQAKAMEENIAALEKATKIYDLSPEQAKTLLSDLTTRRLEKGRTNYEFFKHARFDIRQNFAEGFDPDRIAVAFTQDLVALGDRRLQSAHAPVFAGRGS